MFSIPLYDKTSYISQNNEIAQEVKQCNLDLVKHPDSPKLHLKLAGIFFKAKSDELAWKELFEAGMAYYNRHLYGEAHRCFSRVEGKPNPFVEKAKGMLGNIAIIRGDYPYASVKCRTLHLDDNSHRFEALKSVDLALSVNPDDNFAMMRKAELLSIGIPPEKEIATIEFFQQLLSVAEEDERSELFFLYGKTLLSMGKIDGIQRLKEAFWEVFHLKSGGSVSTDIANAILRSLRGKTQLDLNVLEQFVQMVEFEEEGVIHKWSPEGKYINSSSEPIRIELSVCDYIERVKPKNIQIPYLYSLREEVATSEMEKIRLKNQYLSFFQDNDPTRQRVFATHTTTELGHPNGRGELNSLIVQCLDQKVPWRDFHRTVWEKIWQLPHFPLQYIFTFKYGILVGNQWQEVGRSSNFLFLCLATAELNTFIRLLTICDDDLVTLRDSSGNTLLHIACLYGLDVLVEKILIKQSQHGNLKKLLNARNSDGTNPLGMLFINLPLVSQRDQRVVKIVKLFLQQPLFLVNNYLNSSKGMDYRNHEKNVIGHPTRSLEHLKIIGGKTLVHIAFDLDMLDILSELEKRNGSLSLESLSEQFVNFRYPSLNPNYHMCSPEKFIHEQSPNQAQLRQKIKEYQQAFETMDAGDESGDSDDEFAPASHYKRILMDLSGLVQSASIYPLNQMVDDICRDLDQEQRPMNLTEERVKNYKSILDRACVPHFHGVPLMPSQYTNAHRRYVGFEVKRLNQHRIRQIEGERVQPEPKEDKILRGIHSRTSTATAGLQSLFELVMASSEKLYELEAIDRELNRELAFSWLEDDKKFTEALKKYVNNFKSNPIEGFWNELYEKRNDNIVRYRFPICSLSKAPDHAVRFGIGDNVESAQRGEEALAPHYHIDGKPRHRFAGLIYITSHTIKEWMFAQDSFTVADITRLHRTKVINVNDRYTHQIEVCAFGGVSGENVKLIIPIVYPNFKKPFQRGYHDVVWGLTAEEMSTIQSNLSQKKEVKIKLKVRITNFCLKLIEAIARYEALQLVFCRPGGGISPFSCELAPIKDKELSSVQRKIRDEVRENLIVDSTEFHKSTLLRQLVYQD